MPVQSSRFKRVTVAVLCGAILGVPAALAAGLSKTNTALPVRATAARPISQLIVKYKNETEATHAKGISSARMTALAARTGLKLGYKRPMSGRAHVLSLPAAMSVTDARTLAARIAQDPNVEYAQPDYIRRVTVVPVVPNDPVYTSGLDLTDGARQGQWNMMAPTDDYTYAVAPGGNTHTVKPVGGANLPTAWYVNRGYGVVVGVVDTGVVAHPDLVSNLVGGTPASSGYDFIQSNAFSGATDSHSGEYFTANDGDGRDSDPSDPGDNVARGDCDPVSIDPANDEPSSWHGSHVSGVIAAATNNGVGIAGVAYEAKVLMARALGRCGGAVSDIKDAAIWAAGGTVSGVPANANRAKVINLSLGGSVYDGTACSPAEQTAVDELRALGAVVIASTGNDGAANIIPPASCAGVIAVTAHTIEGDSADYANVGDSGGTTPSNTTTISAPGGGCATILSSNHSPEPCTSINQYIWSTVNKSTTAPGPLFSYGGFAGTSMAVPHVSGVAAMIKSLQSGAVPDYVRLVLQGTARAFPDGTYCTSWSGRGKCGAGMLDAAAAVALASTGAPAVYAGPEQVVQAGATVTLHGEVAGVSGSTPSYQWSVLSGTASLSSPTVLAPTFTASTSGEVKLKLTANDGVHAPSSSTTTVYVISGHPPIVSIASPTVTVTEGQTATFTASATDQDSDPTTIEMVSGPSGATMSTSGAFTWTNAGPAGTYPVVVRANDGVLNSDNVVATIIVNASTTSGGGGSGGDTGGDTGGSGSGSGGSGGGGSTASGGGGGGGSVGWLGLALLALAGAGLRRNRVLR